MTKYDYDWLIRQYKQELGDMDSDALEALIVFIESNRSRTIYYNLAILFFYKKPLWCINLVAHREVGQAIKNTALAPFKDKIVKKILTDAKAKALQSVDYHAYDWRSHSRYGESQKKEFLSLIKDKIIKILAIKA